jgi:hypothetical protein
MLAARPVSVNRTPRTHLRVLPPLGAVPSRKAPSAAVSVGRFVRRHDDARGALNSVGSGTNASTFPRGSRGLASLQYTIRNGGSRGGVYVYRRTENV